MASKGKIIGIYKIVSPSGKVYIGQTMNWGKRKRVYKALNCKNQGHLYNSFVKYGFEKHKMEIIHLCEEHELDKLEIYYGELFNSRDLQTGLNIRYFGHNGRHSEETRKKIGAIHKGKIISEEHKKALSIANKGMVISKETKDKRKATRNTEEWKIKNAGYIDGKKNPMWGKKHSDETKRKIGEKSKLKIFSEEYKSKLSAAQKGKGVKIILNTKTGIYYFGVKEAAISENILLTSLYSKLNGWVKNNTPFIYT